MTDVTVDQLLAIGTSQESTANTIIQQNGLTFKGPTRPNPPVQINVLSQAQLEVSILGSDLEVPDDARVTVVIDASFDLTKPFKLGDGSVLEVYGSTVEVALNYTGTGAMFQLTTLGVDCRALMLRDLFITGDGTQPLFDLKGTSRLVLDRHRIQGFAGGIAEFPFVRISSLAAVEWTKGIVIRNTNGVVILGSNLRQFSAQNLTFLSFLTNIVSSVVISNNSDSPIDALDSLVFFDPNSPTGSSYRIEGTSVSGGNFYQPGTDIPITLVGDNGSGMTRFVTSSAHGLVTGQLVVLKDFATQTTYNQTAIVTAVDTPIIGTMFDADITFVATDTGTMNAASLDQTDILVCAQNNPDSPNSQSIGGWFHISNVALTTVADGTFGALNLSTGGGVTEFTENERFTLDVANDGTLQYNGIQSITVTLIGVLSISKTGSSANYNLRFAIDRGSGFVALPTTIERSQEISSTSRDSTLNQQVILDTGDKIRIEIEGVSTTDDVTVIFGSLDIT